MISEMIPDATGLENPIMAGLWTIHFEARWRLCFRHKRLKGGVIGGSRAALSEDRRDSSVYKIAGYKAADVG
jgi:hypothetical protein